MSGQEDKSEEDKLTFYSLDNNLKQLQCGTQFNIKNVDTTIDPIIDPVDDPTIDPVDDFTIDSTVCYLKLTIDTVQHLSLFHLFLWQHRQGLLFQTSIQLIIIQNTLKQSSTNVTDPVINVSEYWQNLVSLSIQMGFSVYSYQQGEQIKQIKLNKRIEDEIILFEFKYQIIIVSQYSSIDTESLPYCSSVKDKSTQQQKDKNKQKTFPQFMPSYLSSTEKQVILQKIGLSSHKLPVYAHLLPMILGYSAYLIYKQMLESNNKVDGQCILISQQIYNNADMKVNYQKFFKINNIESQQVYNDEDILENFTNSFELPIHLLEVFEFDQNNKFIFQQMCDVSYMFKAQYFAIFSAFFKLDNAVLSQSSRSGKTVTLHTVFYFNLFSGLKIPILINIGYQSDANELQVQPLYDRSSIKLGDNMKEIFAPSTNTTIESIVGENLKQGLISQNYYSYIVSKINIFIQCFQQKTQSKFICYVFDEYYSGKKKFDQFQNISSVDFFQINSLIYNRGNKNLQVQLKLTNKKIRRQEEQKKIIRLQDSYEKFIQNKKYDDKKEVLVLVDECLNQQRNNYKEITGKIVQFTEQYMDRFLGQARSCIEHVVQMLERSIATEVVEKIQLWLGDKTSIDKNSDKSDIKKKLTDKINQILGSDQIEEYFLKLLCYYDLLIGTNAAAIVDLIAISSPNFIHVKTSCVVLNSFSEMMSDLKKYPNKDVFKQKLYHFLLMLYNPRGMETIFWRNICYAMDQSDQPERFSNTFSVDDKIDEYFTNRYDFAQKLNSIFENQFSLKMQLDFSLQYQKIPIIKHGSFNFLSAGTDLALINFIRQNQFLYTSESSRGAIDYTQSNILGTSQMHPSCLTQNYYRDMRITTQPYDSMIKQITQRVQKMSIRDFYLMMIPELAAELQFLCPLICPQIIINKEQNEYLFNSTQLFEYKVNKKEISLNQISSHTQILNSLFILRSGQTVGAKQLVNDLVLLENKSIAVFNTDLHLTSSSSLNRDVVFALNFLASQKFFVTLIQLSCVSDEVQLSDLCSAGQINCLLQQQNISEISSAILLVASLCRQHPTHIIGLNKFLKQINKYSQYLEIYVNPLQTQYNQQKTLAQVYEQLQSLFQGAFTMFLQKSFDSYWNDGQPKMEVYVKDAVKNASVCFIKLQQLNLLKEDQKLVIVTILDKTKISDQFFNPAPPMPDYLISLFGVSDQEVQDFPANEILSIQPNQVEGQSVYSINLLMDSGTHDGQEMFKKQKDTKIATCFQVTKEYKQNSMQICLHHQVSPKYGAIIEKHEYYLAKQDEQKSSHELIQQLTFQCQLAQKRKFNAQKEWKENLINQCRIIIDKFDAEELECEIEQQEEIQQQLNKTLKDIMISKANAQLMNQQLKSDEIYLKRAKLLVNLTQQTIQLEEQIMQNKNITLEEAQKQKKILEENNQKEKMKINQEVESQEIKLKKQKEHYDSVDKDVNDKDLVFSEITNKTDTEQKMNKYLDEVSILEQKIQASNIALTVVQNTESIESQVQMAQALAKKANIQSETANQSYLEALRQESLIEAAEKKINTEINERQLNCAVQKIPFLVKDEQSYVVRQQLDHKEIRDTVKFLNTYIIQEKATLDSIQQEISKKSEQDQRFINNYIDTWNQLMSQQTVSEQLPEQQKTNQQLVMSHDMNELFKLLNELSEIQVAYKKKILTSSQYAAQAVSYITKSENQILQQQIDETPNQSEQKMAEDVDLEKQIQLWCCEVLVESQKTKIEISDFIKQWQTLLHQTESICNLVLKVLIEKLKSTVKQQKLQFNYDQKRQAKDGNTLTETEKIIFIQDQNQRQQKEIDKEKQEKQKFNKTFFLLDIFYFTNYTRENNHSGLFIDYLNYMVEKTAQKIISEIDLYEKTKNLTEQQKQNLSQDELEQNQIGVYVIFKFINKETLESIFPFQFNNVDSYYHCADYQTIESVLHQATIPIKVAKQVPKVFNNHKVNVSELQFTYEQQFRQFGKFYLPTDSKSQCIRGGDSVWISHNCITEVATPLQFTPYLLLQILQQINSLVDSEITYKLLGNEIPHTLVLEGTDIIKLLLQNHLFPVAIDGNTLIVDQLSDDNKVLGRTDTSVQKIKFWFINYPENIPKDYEKPQINSYINQFKPEIFTENIAVSANLELFSKKMTLENQIQTAIDAGIKDANGGQIQLNFTDFDENKLQNTSTINNPSKEKTIHALCAYKLIYLQYKIRTSDDGAIINLMCIEVL